MWPMRATSVSRNLRFPSRERENYRAVGRKRPERGSPSSFSWRRQQVRQRIGSGATDFGVFIIERPEQGLPGGVEGSFQSGLGAAPDRAEAPQSLSSGAAHARI